MHFFTLAALAVALSTVCQAAGAQWPVKPIRFIVPNTPGGGLDLMARVVAQKTGEVLGQNGIVENRPGGDSIIGAEHVARSAPDGYTILVGNASSNMANIFLHKTLPYDPVKDFAPITGGVQSITCLVVNAALPVNSVRELIDYARANPGKLSYGSSGTSGAYYLSGEAFKAATGVDMQHIGYKGLGPAMNDLVSGQIAVTFTSVTVGLPQSKAGKARILAIVEGKRYSAMPEVPTVAETIAGYKGGTIWNGFFAPAGTPNAIVNRLNVEILKVLNSADLRAKLDATEVIGGTPEQFAAYVRAEVENFGRLVKLLNLKQG